MPLLMLPSRSVRHLSRRPCSYSLISPMGRISSTPFLPRSTGDEKKLVGCTSLSTNVYSTTFCSPFRARMRLNANSAPAKAIESVALPVPALACTTSSPPNWMRCVRASSSSLVNSNSVCDSSGTIVGPECPPTTGIFTSSTLTFFSCDTNVLARTRSRVVTPNSFFGLYTPAAFRVSAKMGTVELTGLEMIRKHASGQCSAQALASVCTIEALVLKRSSRVMPGFLGTPAGMITTSLPFRASPRSSPTKPLTGAGVEMWPRSAATPGVLTMSNRVRSVVRFEFFIRSDSGWPMPPEAPRTATLAMRAALRQSIVESKGVFVLDSKRCQ
eukprot:Rhum_TRINITY_DN4593_c0_g1::Rhum_TRINITY_DN4593_c0_g1_i1::g.14984::m.14984